MHLSLTVVRRPPALSPSKPIEETAREYDLDPSTIAKLASNENSLDRPPCCSGDSGR